MLLKVFDKIIPEDKKEFQDFWSLNNIIERDNVTIDQVKTAYHDILLWTLGDHEKTELHYQIQYLFEEIKIPVNKILAFLDIKFSSLEDAITKIIKQTKLKDSGIWEGMHILTGLEYAWVIKVITSNVYSKDRRVVIELEFPEIETAQERFAIVKDFLFKLDDGIQHGDLITLESRVRIHKK